MFKCFAIVVCIVSASVAHAQPPCRTEMVPALAPWTDGPTTSGTAQYFWAVPPTNSEPWGHLEYPIIYEYPSSATSVSLITLMATTFKLTGWQIRQLGFGGFTSKTYVKGRSGQYHEWVPDGIQFIWYHLPNLSVFNGVDDAGVAQKEFYITMKTGDQEGFTGDNLSVPLLRNEAVVLGVGVIFPYPEPILVETQLHLRVCR